MNYEQDLKIDEDALDIEWLDQASLFMKYAKIAAEARRNLDEAKQALDIIKAEIDKDIREKPSEYGLEKVTDKAIDAIILNEKEYQVVWNKFLDMKYEADMASNAVVAMNQRKEALENLVKLHGQSYFAGPKLPRNLSEERDMKQKKADIKIANKLTRQR
jgi:hypothetical protein